MVDSCSVTCVILTTVKLSMFWGDLQLEQGLLEIIIAVINIMEMFTTKEFKIFTC